MQSYNLEFNASEVANLKGDEAKVGFINHFKDVQRYKTQLSQYVDLTDVADASVVSDSQSEYGFTDDDLLAFRGAYLNLAYSLKKKREKTTEPVSPEIEDLDFEFVLFASAMIDYDYIMDLIAKQYGGTGVKVKLTREQLVNLVLSNSNLMDERDDIIAYINSLEEVNGKTEQEIKEGYNRFREERYAKEIASIAALRIRRQQRKQQRPHRLAGRRRRMAHLPERHQATGQRQRRHPRRMGCPQPARRQDLPRPGPRQRIFLPRTLHQQPRGRHHERRMRRQQRFALLPGFLKPLPARYHRTGRPVVCNVYIANGRPSVVPLPIFNKKVKLKGWQDERKRLTLPSVLRCGTTFF